MIEITYKPTPGADARRAALWKLINGPKNENGTEAKIRADSGGSDVDADDSARST